jgi:hypothetical protein
MRRLIALLAVSGLLVAGCSANPTSTGEYQELEQQLADSQQALAEMTAERDSLLVVAGDMSERYEKTLSNQQAVEDILHNPESYGSEEDVVELLATYATAEAVMDDAVFGAAPIQTAWYNTLYGGAMDAEIENYHRWLSEDGSQGGVLWIWRGNNLVGNPFELAGISLNEYDENGLLTYEYVVYPYSDQYVREAVTGSGTGQGSDETETSGVATPDPWGLDAVTDPTTQEQVNAIFLAMPDEIDGMTAYRDDPDHVGYVEYTSEDSDAMVAWDDLGSDRETTIEQLEWIADKDVFTEHARSMDSDSATVWLHGTVDTGEVERQMLWWGDPSDGWLFRFDADTAEHLDAIVGSFISASTE